METGNHIVQTGLPRQLKIYIAVVSLVGIALVIYLSYDTSWGLVHLGQLVVSPDDFAG